MTTGKESSKTTDFNQGNWAVKTTGYLGSIKKTFSTANLNRFNDIVNAAKTFVKTTSRSGLGDTSTFNLNKSEQDVDERAFLCDDESDDCAGA